MTASMPMSNLQHITVTKTVDVSNLSNGYIEIQCTWPTPYAPSPNPSEQPYGYRMVANFCHRSSNPDAKNCCLDAGLRDIGPGGFIQVISFNGKVDAGDIIDVMALGWQ
jgi:hypothetical protein